jgi:hypothetical protein
MRTVNNEKVRRAFFCRPGATYLSMIIVEPTAADTPITNQRRFASQYGMSAKGSRTTQRNSG